MTAKQSSKSRYKNSKLKQKSSSAAIATVLGTILLLTANNVRSAFQSIEQQQLVSLPSDVFKSDRFEPIEFGNSKQIAQRDFSRIDNVAKNLNYAGTSVTELANILERNAVTESDKARIIYAWIAQHITYSVPAFLDAVNNDIYPNVNPEIVLRDRRTICSGYSNLYYALAEAMGLESAIVVGYAKGATPDDPRFQDVNHAWNAVKIDGGWYLLDATWGAGSVREQEFVPEYKPYYFATAPAEFINNHYPQDRGWQLLSQSYTRAKFDNLPNITSRFYGLGLKLTSHHNYQIATSDRVDLKLKAPQNVVAIAELKLAERDTENAVLVNRQAEHLTISVAPPKAGTYELTIYAKEKDDLGQYAEVITYQIEATQPVAELPKTYSHFHQYQASLVEPLQAELQSNWSTYFNFVVPEAIDVQAINTDTKQWTPLNSYGSYFAGHVTIQPGNTVVVAKFPGDDRYWQLTEYFAE